MTSGVFQGSVLGPLIFLLYINDLPEVLNCEKTSIRLLADDAILYRPINTLADCQLLQNQLCRVTTWAEEWQLVFNINKCTATSMSPAHTQFTYSSGNTALASTETFTYLGVLVHSSLSYKEHINYTSRKASRILFAIMRALKGASQQAKRTAFLVFLPLLEYASEIWNPHLWYLVQDLELINRKAFRWACRFGKYEHISSAMEEFNWPTLGDRSKLKDCHTLEKILAHDFEVNYKLFTHNTRRANIRHTINTDAMQHSFFNRAMEL